VRSEKRIIIVGGGITGLAAAHRVMAQAQAADLPIKILLLEARDRLGGSIVTHRRDGFLVEGGPDSFITAKPWALSLCKRIDIDDQLIPTDAHHRRVYVVRSGKLFALPEGFLLLAPTRFWPFIISRLFSWPGKFRMGLDLLLPARKRQPEDDESLADFVRRRLGREALERIAQPLVGGIYTADAEQLSLRATMPRFLELEDKYGSVILGMYKGRKAAATQSTGDSGARYSMFVSFANGMSTLINTLASRLPAGSMRTNSPVARIEPDNDRWRVVCSDGTVEPADALILACPAHVSAKLLNKATPELSSELATIEYASSAMMSIAFRRNQVRHAMDGFGFVVPTSGNRSMIAGTFASVKFPGRAPADHVLIRTFLGGAVRPHIYDLDDSELRKRVLMDLRDLIGIDGEPLFTEIHRWPRSMPQYPVGHLNRVARMDELITQHPNLALAGNAFGGVGIPDCIHSGETAAERIIDRLQTHRA